MLQREEKLKISGIPLKALSVSYQFCTFRIFQIGFPYLKSTRSYWRLRYLLVILSSCFQLLCHGHRGQLLQTNHRCDTENQKGDTRVKTRTQTQKHKKWSILFQLGVRRLPVIRQEVKQVPKENETKYFVWHQSLQIISLVLIWTLANVNEL